MVQRPIWLDATMKPETHSLPILAPNARQDKQLRGITLEEVLEKRRLDQALNAKEFAVLAGVSYSTAREWFRTPGFPVFRGVVFWGDFAVWRTQRPGESRDAVVHRRNFSAAKNTTAVSLPPRAARILREV